MAKNSKKNEVIRIHKEFGKRKNAIRVTGEKDIPNFLKTSITIENGIVRLVCVEGTKNCKLGSVIGYETSTLTETGYNCRCIENADTNLLEIDGIFYEKPTIFKAQLISDVVPEFVSKAKISKNVDGSFTLETTLGNVTGKPGKAYWVLHGTNKDGSPDVNILTKTEESYKEYIICDENDEDIGLLCECNPPD